MKLFLKTISIIFIFLPVLVFVTDSNAGSAYKIENNTVFYGITEIKSADPATFTILNEHLAKDKDQVYCGSSLISGADANSLNIVSYIYVKDSRSVYYCDRNYSENKKIEGSDPATFEVVTDFYAKDRNAVYHEGCWNQYCTFTITKIDPKTFQVVDAGLGIVKDRNRVYANSNLAFPDSDPKTFKVLYNSYYSKDWKNVYYLQCGRGGCLAEKLKTADAATFQVFKEDTGYAMDKNNFYFGGTLFTNKGIAVKNYYLYKKLKGKIILTVQNGGEAYCVSPKEKMIYYLSRPVIAFQILREQGIGILNKDLEKIPVGGKCPAYLPSCDNAAAYVTDFAKEQLGKIFIQVETNGEAWYVNPADAKRYFLGRPSDAFDIMRTLSIGISNKDFEEMKK
jgi:hypothetical protein